MRSAVNGLGAPLVPGVGVLALVPDRWSDLWQPRHQVLTRLARYFHVLWMNPAREWRQVLTAPAGRGSQRLGEAPHEGLEVGEGFGATAGGVDVDHDQAGASPGATANQQRD